MVRPSLARQHVLSSLGSAQVSAEAVVQLHPARSPHSPKHQEHLARMRDEAQKRCVQTCCSEELEKKKLGLELLLDLSWKKGRVRLEEGGFYSM